MNVDVFITKTAAFLPLAPVSNDEIENVLGMVGGKPSRARRIVLRSNGIQSRHYAIDPQTGKIVYTNAKLTSMAIQGLQLVGDVDCLVTGTSIADQIMPNHGVMVHGELGWGPLQVISTTGICLSGITALKYAWLSVKAGDSQRAVATGSELASPMLLAKHFAAESEHQVRELNQRPEISFEKEFLRWMLSDGAGAMLLEPTPSAPLSLRVDWIELSSAAHELPVCMYAGAEKNDDQSLTGWLHYPADAWGEKSIFAIKQDVRLLDQHIANATFVVPLKRIITKYNLKANAIDWFLPHMSSLYFAATMEASLTEMGLPIPRARWFFNLEQKGNTGSASPYIMLDELFRSGRIKKGQKLLMFIPESGRFSSGFVYMEAV